MEKHLNFPRQLQLTNISQQTHTLSQISSLRSFTYLQCFCFFRRVKTPELECRCRTGRLSASSLFSTQTSEATRQLAVLGYITVTSTGARESSGRAGSRSVRGVGHSAPAAEARGQAHREKGWAGVGSAGRLFRLSFPEWKQSLRVNG